MTGLNEGGTPIREEERTIAAAEPAAKPSARQTRSPVVRRVRNRLARTPLRWPLTWWRHRVLEDNDVMLASYPRSGNTWLRFLLYQLLKGRPASFADLDAPDSVAGHVELAVPVPRSLPNHGRLLKTHEPWRPEYGRAVFLLRDVRAVAVSEYKFSRWRGFFTGELDEFVDAFIAGEVNPFGTWNAHYDSWRESALVKTGDLLVVRYEELREQPVPGLGRIAEFLGLGPGQRQLEQVVGDNTVERLREREDVERESFHRGADRDFRFVNRGRAAGWREVLSARAIARLTELGRSVDDWSGYE